MMWNLLELYRNIFVYRIECSICLRKARKFRAFNGRLGAQCYYCGSLERQRLLEKFFVNTTDLFTSKHRKKLLHFAPEVYFYHKFSTAEYIDYTPCDLFPENYNFGGKVPVRKMDITNINLEDKSVDIIICNHVLEHVPDDKLAMQELFRVLRPGGWAVLQVPIDKGRQTTYEDFTITDPKEREKAFGQFDHVRWYGRDYTNRISDAGFEVDAIDFTNSFSEKEVKKYGFQKGEQIYFCRRP